jgi:hypothetical protein
MTSSGVILLSGNVMNVDSHGCENVENLHEQCREEGGMHRSLNDEHRMTMTTKSLVVCGLLSFLLIWAIGVGWAQQTTTDIKGTWSGTFISRNSDIPPFTITVKIISDSQAHLIGDASLVSACLDSHQLKVTVSGSNIVLAGSDAQDDSVTFRGSIDSAGTLLTLNYIINGSASGRCEIDNGTGTMGKR